VTSVPSYKREKPQGSYDAIIIGSGLGALTCGALLAKRGKKCLLLERHYVLGGFTHVFKRKGFEWDVGVHYVGEVHKPTSVLKQLFDHITDGSLQWAEMGEVYDRIVIGDDHYPLRKGVQGFKDSLGEAFPDAKDQAAIETYVNTVFEVVKASRNYFAEKALSGLAAKTAGPMMRRKYLKYARQTTLEVLRSMTDNEKLIGVLAGQYGDYGLPPAQSSFAMHATLVKHYFGGGSYPVCGSARIADSIVPGIVAAGGACFTNADVEEIVVEKGKAIGVRMADGEVIKAPMVISTAGAHNTYQRLLAPEQAKSIGFASELQSIQASAAHVSLYIGLEGTPEELNLPKANYWIYPSYDHDAAVQAFQEDDKAPLPVCYISFPAAKDPDFQKRYPGKSTIEIITLAPWERFEKWKDTRWKKRGEDYDAMKAEISERLLEQLFRFEPQVKDAIVYHELSTPLSTRHFVNYAKGEIYGLAHDPERFESKFLKPKSPIDNLWLSGQDIATCGIGGALLSGFLTVSAIEKTNLIMDLLKAG
jgi:all-trans-retinol 13,14-reductase